MKIVRIMGIICIAAGLLIYLTPQIREIRLRQELFALRCAEPAEETEGIESERAENSSEAAGKEQAEEDLYTQMETYNRKLYKSGQEFTGPETYEQNPLGVDGAIGSVRIPDMDVELPLYIGATYEHLDQGAAVLGGISMPIGGENSNCVISGHRSWCGAPYFRDIEVLEKGSEVLINNGRETLHYRVFETKIILPDQTEALLIQPGKDLVTLITCHPYMGGGTHRYLVYCERCEENAKDEKREDTGQRQEKLREDAPHGKEEIQTVKSRDDRAADMIRKEKGLRRLMVWVILAVSVILLLR